MNMEYAQKIAALAATPVAEKVLDDFVNGFCRAPIEDLPNIRSAVRPWISLLPTLIHLAGGYGTEQFTAVAKYCVDNYRLVTVHAAQAVLNAMTEMLVIFENEQLLVNNWNVLRGRILNNIGADSYLVGEFTCD